MGRVKQRVDGAGTTSYTWDDLGKLLSAGNSFDAVTTSYTYDLAGALASETTGMGTTSYRYDPAHQLTAMAYPQQGGTQYTYFANDANGRRTDAWLQSDAGHTVWAAHSHTDYDTSGRVVHVLGQNGPATGPTTVLDQSTCYAAGAVAPDCPTTASADRSKIRWVTDAVSGETSTYGYDGTSGGQTGRLLTVAVTGGSNPRTYQYTYDAAGNRRTAALTHDSLLAGQTLTSGQSLTSDDGATRLVMQYDGNAVLYGPSGALWSTGTSGSSNKLTMQTDGNLVGYPASGAALWASATSGTGNKLAVQTDHNAVVYSASGAALWWTNTGGTPGPVTGVGAALTFNNANQISTAGYSYDGAGNQTASAGGTAAYNTAGQTTATTTAGTAGTSTYVYAGASQNEPLKETTNTGKTYTLAYGRPDSSGLPEIEQVQVSGVTGYVLHDPSGLPVMLQTRNAVTALYLYDGRNNPVAMSTSFSTTAYALQFDPYGASTLTGGSAGGGGYTQNPYSFGGGIQDRATGHIKFGGRWYDPTTGTWTQQDTYNAPLDPANANRYTYVGGDPINRTDPLGRGVLTDLFGGLIGVSAAVACGVTIVCGVTGLVVGLFITYSINYGLYGEQPCLTVCRY